MNGSVWNAELCQAFLAELKKSVRIVRNGNLIELPGDTSFIVRKPEEEFKTEVLPCVSIYVKDAEYDPVRHFPFKVPVRKDPEHPNFYVIEDTAVPFNLSCQVDFWSRYQTDMDTMTRTWLLRHFKNFGLPAVDNAGNSRDLNVIAVGSLVTSDLMRGKETLYHKILNYLTWVDIDSDTTYNEGIVQTVQIETEDITVKSKG